MSPFNCAPQCQLGLDTVTTLMLDLASMTTHLDSMRPVIAGLSLTMSVVKYQGEYMTMRM